jgi:hypothetical protein
LDEFVMVAERRVALGGVERAVAVFGNLVAVHQAVSDEFAAAVEGAGSRVAEGAQIPAVDRRVEGERKVAEVEPLSAELADPAVDLLQVAAVVFRPDTSKSRQSLAPSKCRPMPPKVALL